ncbi:DUF2242 domain-containing protein, partial [Rhizobium sp. SIMBA_035]
PIRSNSDAMVKISSETIPSGKFYDRFFGLVDHYLQTVVRTQPVANSCIETRILPMPVEATVPAPAVALPDAVVGQAASAQPAHGSVAP